MTKTQRTVYVVGGFCAYEEMFKKHGWIVVDNIDDADLVQFCGGEDVWPGFYGDRIGGRTVFNLTRDKYEKQIFSLALDGGRAIAGICRGAQFVHVMNGGSLYQHVDSHAISGEHSAYVMDEDIVEWYPKGFYVSSTHHQQIKDNVGDVIVASWESTFKETGSGTTNKPEDHAWDVEAIWHKETSCFCYQPHPEFYLTNVPHDCQVFYFKALNHYLFPKRKD
jgi:gamma-glutamyl-gamma-aminobutyrate hydrolase PuuD